MEWTRLKSHWKLIVLLMIPSAAFALMLVQASKNQAIDYLEQSKRSAMREMAEQAALFVRDHMDRAADLMLDVEGTVLQDNTDKEGLPAYMETVAKVRADLIRGIVFIGDDGGMIGYPESYWPSFAAKELSVIESQPLDRYPPIDWSPPFYSNMGKFGLFSTVAMVSKRVYDSDMNPIGRLSMAVDTTGFLNKTIAFVDNYDVQVLLYDQNDNLIDSFMTLGSNPLRPMRQSNEAIRSLPGAQRYFQENGFYYASADIPAHPRWKIVVVSDLEAVERTFRPVTTLSVVVLSVGIVGFMCIYGIVSWWFTRPIRQLAVGMRRIAKGDLHYRMKLERADEFGELAEQYNAMTATIRELIANLKATEERKRRTEMRALLSQMNPHMLYNTINLIDDVIDHGGKEELHRLLEALGELLRYGLDQRRGNVRTLREEIENVEFYWFIVNQRYGQRFTLTVDDSVRRHAPASALKLMLQPLVENALFHGLLPSPNANGVVTVSAERQGDSLVIAVRDNGVGMTPEAAAALEARIAAPEEGEADGIGVRNVHQRLAHTFGAAYGLRIDSGGPGEGTTVRIHIPYRAIEEERR
ncbi:HAMP domain-containing protein [Paenibacillus antri]|uniref:HAMP domain-containing protein n=1 Tax=Paenibacillus antri TaxID=2582848 RepID=A0A5R9GIL9_9BACL|nr:sensor histidine kinase [Paenibacillus antri]TLS53248.1 HAMP domain-containing protein [Paenibacillus antri]